MRNALITAQIASNAENVSIWWRHHGVTISVRFVGPLRPNGQRNFQWNSLVIVDLFHCVRINFESLRSSDAYMRNQINHHRFRSWLVAWSAPSHFLIQCWDIINSNLRNKLLWNLKRNSYIFIQENAFEYVVCEMATMFSRPQWVNAFSTQILEVSGSASRASHLLTTGIVRGIVTGYPVT